MRASYVLAAGLLGACFSDPADVPFTYDVGGTVAGMWDGASITLHLTAGEIDETLTVDANGAFTFDTKVPEQTAFSITIDDEPLGHDCTATSGGTVEMGAIDDLAVTCTGPAVDIALSAPIAWTFDADTLAYDLDVSTLIQQTAVTVTAPDATAIRLDDSDLAENARSAPIALAPGANTLTVEVEAGSAQRTFTIALDRGGVAIEQYVLGKASNAGGADEFGGALAISGDTLVIGAQLEDSGTNQINGPDNNDSTDSGAVYVLRRAGLTWAQEAYIKAPSNATLDWFGGTVAIDGNTLAVGAAGDDGVANANSEAGAVYVFVRDGSSWHHEQTLRAPVETAGDHFGASIAIEGDVIAIGAFNPFAGIGSAYIFRRSGTTWGLEDSVQGSEGGAADSFGLLALSGDTLAVGSSGLLSSTSNGDRVYIYTRSGSDWQEQAIIRPPAHGIGTAFGTGVSLDGDTLVVVAANDSCDCRGVNPVADNSDALYSGAIYIFRGAGTTWVQEAFIKPSNSERLDRFDRANVHGDLVVGGAWEEASAATGVDGSPDDNTAASAGAAYLFRRVGAAWTESNYLKASNTEAGDHFGLALVVGDDGLVIAAPAEDGATGAAYIFH